MKTQEIADFLSAELIGDGSVEIGSVAEINSATVGQIAFAENADSASSTKASCVLVTSELSSESKTAYIRVQNPKLAFAKIAELLHPAKRRDPEIHSTAIIAENAEIGANVFIGAFTGVGEGSKIGDGSHLREGAKIGDNECRWH